MLAAIEGLRKAAHRHGKCAALHCGSANYARRGREAGFDMVTVSNDARLMAAAATQAVQRFREP